MDKAGKPAKDYEIGFGKPPKSAQFVTGRSGNPNGRPKRKFRPKVSDAAYQPFRDMVLHEAYRIVPIREGDKVSKMPAGQAALRSLNVAAMKGDRRAQRICFDLTSAIERQMSEKRLELLAIAVAYKHRYQREFAFRDDLGIPRSEPIPHPDDVHVNARTGEVQFLGPVSLSERAELLEIVGDRDFMQLVINNLAGRPRKTKHETSLRRKAQLGFDEINDIVPQRYQKTLMNRL